MQQSSMRDAARVRRPGAAWLVAAACLLGGCNIGKVTRVVAFPPNAGTAGRACALLSNSGPACPMNAPVDVRVAGVGPCTVLEVDFGDGQNGRIQNHDFGKDESNPNWAVLQHQYSGWPGKKRLKARGITNCAGEAAVEVEFVSSSNGFPFHRLGFQQPVASACSAVPNVPPLRPGTVVSVATTDVAKTDYGCILGGCIFGAGGKPGSSAPSGFPFPGLKEYSQVWRIGAQIEQGGATASFTVNQRAPLEICVNDTNMADNHGAWRVDITVDERNAR